MKTLPEMPNIDPKPLVDIMQGAEKYFILFSAVELEVFDHLKQPKKAEEIANELHSNVILTVKFLNSLVSLGLLKKEKSTYSNTSLSETYLTKYSPFYQGNIVKLKRIKKIDYWLNLSDIVKNGPYTKQNANSNDGKNLLNFTMAMAESAIRENLFVVRDILSSLPEFNHATKLLDLGGGHGLYAIILSQTNENLISYVLDYPSVLKTTQKFINKYEMNDKVKVLARDFTKDDWGTNSYDIIFASDCLYYPEDMLIPLLIKTKKYLNVDGLFVSKHWILDNDKTSPPTTVLWDLGISLTTGMPLYTYTKDEYAKLLTKHGFRDIKTYDISTSSKKGTLFITRNEK